MAKQAITALAFSLVAASAWAQEEPPAPEVVITGQRPGPGLWKVSKGEHVMYVFGDYAPLPIKMDWRSHEVEAILSKSQEFLAKPNFGMQVGWWGGLKALPHMIGFKDNPDGAKLVDVLPAETYDRWQALKAKYIGKDNGIERERPVFAGETLYKRGLEKNGLTMHTNVGDTIFKIAERHKVKVTRSSVGMELENPGQALREFKSPVATDVACFTKTVENLETDLDDMRVRANAWAVGDMSKIKSLSFAERDDACLDALKNNAAFKGNEKVQQAEQVMRRKWLDNAERALENNSTTFAVLPLRQLLDPRGYLADLQAKGYTVAAPE
jgi:hypothetical protein